MTNRKVTMQDVELLVTLAQQGSLKGAAERLNLTSSALSHRLADMRHRLGFPVSERRGRVHLTPMAWRLVPQAQEILDTLDRLEAAIQELPGVRRLGISTLLMRADFRPLLADLLEADREGPWDIVSGHSDEVQTWVEEGRLDAGFVRLDRRRPGLYYHWVAEDSLVAAASPSFASQEIPANWPWVLYAPTMGHGRVVEQALRDAGLVITPQVRVDSFDFALALVERGAVSVFPYAMVSGLIASGDLKEIEVPGVIWPTRRTALVTRTESPFWVGTLARALAKRR